MLQKQVKPRNAAGQKNGGGEDSKSVRSLNSD